MTRHLAAAAILVAGACTTAMNWRFSYQLGTTLWDSYTWAIFSVALDVTKWLMLPFAALAWRDHKLRACAAFAIWVVATIYSFTAAIGFAALNREAVVTDRESQAELHKTLKLMQQSPRWQSSAACADATAPLSKEFCTRYAAAEAQLKSVPQETDPQSALLARITRLSPDTTRLILCVFLAVACEVISALGFFAIMVPTPKSPSQSKTVARWKPPKWSAAPPNRATNRAQFPRVARHDAT